MSTLCTITGTLRDLTGAVLPNTQVTFVRSGVAGQDGSTVIPRIVKATSDASGVITVTLYAGNYTATTVGADSGTTTFSVAVPADATAVLSDLIDAAPTTVTPQAVLDAQAARDAAAASATDAATSATEAEGWANASAASAASAASVAQQDLSAFSAAMTYTPVDVVVGRMADWSDGGFNMRVIQPRTSWYNEPLAAGDWLGEAANETAARALAGAGTGSYYHNTTDGKFYSLNATSGQTEVFRGNKAGFPEEYVVVAEASRVIIFDATDPSLPMWMVFTGFGANLLVTSTGVLSVAFDHAVMVCGTIYGAVEANFIKDSGLDHRHTNSVSYAGDYLGNIAERNASKGFAKNLTSFIIESTINDVAITVLPDAPIDPTTGMPVPTIAVATDGGVSQIGWDGTGNTDAVLDFSYSSQSKAVSISFTPYNKLSWAGQSNAFSYTRGHFVADILTADVVGKVFNSGGGLIEHVYFPTGYFPALPQFSTNYDYLVASDGKSVGMDVGVAIFDDYIDLHKTSSVQSKGMVNYLTTTYQSGWMVGDIRRCWLSFTSNSSAEAVKDRSVKDSPLTATGTPTLSPVASGADLYEARGFSSSIYYEEAYSSDLDFGTGGFAIIFSLQMAANSATETVLERDSTTSAQRFTIEVTAGGYLQFTVDDGTTTRTATGSSAIDDGARRSCACYYDGSGGVYVYVNGALYASATGAALLTMDNGAAVSRIGLSVAGANPLTSGSVCLVRLGGTVPSADQIRHIYETEKVLFQDNAKCTLYGTSDAVTDMAYDEIKGLLHVGTSSGRSTFDGLRRIDNSTTAVTKLAANNGLLVEM